MEKHVPHTIFVLFKQFQAESSMTVNDKIKRIDYNINMWHKYIY